MNQASSNNLKMRTRSTKGPKVALDFCTEFTLHISQQGRLSEKRKSLIDYSEKRLINYINKTEDAQQKMMLVALLHDYCKGQVALAWKRGQPVYIQVTKA
jgi:hypothetical protein